MQESESESEVAQACPAVCDPMDCSLPGSWVHGIFQATVLEWVAISFSKGSSQPRDQTQVSRIAGRRYCKPVAHQAPLSMGFPRQEYWSVLPFPSPGDLPAPGIEPASPALAGGFFTAEPPWKPSVLCILADAITDFSNIVYPM